MECGIGAEHTEGGRMRAVSTTHAQTFRELHVPGKMLLLANVWDAGSARLIESCGAAAIATTSAGLAWSRGYPDGDLLPSRVLAAAIAEITRVLSVPLSADVEGGYSADPRAVGEMIAAVLDAGAVAAIKPRAATATSFRRSPTPPRSTRSSRRRRYR